MKLEKDDRMKEEEEEHDIPAEFANPVPWQKIETEGLDCDYAQLFSKDKADHLFHKLEEELVYSTGTKSLFSKVLTGKETVNDCSSVCPRWGSNSSSVWKGLQHTQKTGHLWRCRPNLHLFWDQTDGLSVDSNTGIHSGCRHDHHGTHIQLCSGQQVRNECEFWERSPSWMRFFFLLHQVQRRSGSHGWASRWRKRAGPPVSHRLRLPRGSARFYLPAQRCSGENDPAADRACEAGAGSRKPPAHEPPHQHILVPQPPCSQEDFPAPYKPHVQTRSEEEMSQTKA